MFFRKGKNIMILNFIAEIIFSFLIIAVLYGVLRDFMGADHGQKK